MSKTYSIRREIQPGQKPAEMEVKAENLTRKEVRWWIGLMQDNPAWYGRMVRIVDSEGTEWSVDDWEYANG